VLKSQHKKKILNIRKRKYPSNVEINFNNIIKIVKKEKINNKIIGGYYPYNYEVNVVKILEKFEKLIDEAADEISSFVEKANLENLS